MTDWATKVLNILNVDVDCVRLGLCVLPLQNKYYPEQKNFLVVSDQIRLDWIEDEPVMVRSAKVHGDLFNSITKDFLFTERQKMTSHKDGCLCWTPSGS